MTDAATPGFADRLLGRARGEPTPLRPKLVPFYAPMPETPEPVLDEPVPSAAPAATRIEAPTGPLPPPAVAAPQAPRRREPVEPWSELMPLTRAEPAPLMPAPPAPVVAGIPVATVPRRAEEPVQRTLAEGAAKPPVPPVGPVIRVADPAPAPAQPTPALSPPAARSQPDIAAALALALARLTGPTAAPAERLMPPEPPPVDAPASRNTPRHDGPGPAPVHIHIGEIVVAADPPPSPPPAAPRRPDWSPVLTLEAYRASRQRGSR
jgi:hypothetical protein